MGIYQHFRQEEHTFIDQVLSWKTSVERTYIHKLTDFLDPRKQQIIKSLIGNKNDEIKISFYGGDRSERKRAIISPYYEEITEESFQVSVIQASFHSKFISLEHGDVMGAYLSLGLERSTLGDIFVKDGMVQIIMVKEISQYVTMNLTTIKNATVQLAEVPTSSLFVNELNWINQEQTVSSLRLDVVLKGIYNISRKSATNFIRKNLVKVNFETINDRTFPLHEGDLISVRSKGRSKLVEINGVTRKNNLRITTALLK